MLADPLGKSGLPEEGLSLVDEVLDIVAENGEGVWLAELLDLKDKLFLIAGANAESVDQCFQQAIDAAHCQGDKCFELRAAINLARLWQKQGKAAEARELLAPIYGWFTEGFDTPDLVDAKALFEEIT